MDNISTTAQKISIALGIITIILDFGQSWCPIHDTFSARIVQFIRDEANWSLQISYMHPSGQSMNSNLGYTMYNSHITTLLSHSHINEFLIRANLKLVIVWYIGGIRRCSTRTSSIYPWGWYIYSNLSYVICSKYTTTVLVHEQVKFPLQNRFFANIVRNNCARESFSDSILSLYAYGRYVNSNLGYVICSTRSNLILFNTGYVVTL